ncbi:MAG TPA: hypothetical protein PKL17_06900 [Pseudomonadota bacterium]|nr:hypothetical protein [Pseudomonadota bacterium]HNK44491.1 hypothetical protein [Pseudomonadota bacterium]HNN52409.1 hypothetical protein [Pseudomonadota bacterium]
MQTKFAVPLLLLAGSCTTARPPSAEFLARAEQIPPPTSMLLPSAQRAFAAWQLPQDDPWSRFNKWTLLSSLGEQVTAGELPDVRNLVLLQRAELLGARLGAAGLPPDTLWIVDLRGAAAVAFGNAVSHAAPHPVSLVMTFNNWPAADELIPAEETLAALVTMRPRLPEIGTSGSRPVFLLDSWRLAYRDQELAEETIDNRYYLTTSDFPEPAQLVEHGIRRIVYLTETLGGSPDQAVEEDDLHETFLRYSQAGLSLSMLGLDELDDPQPMMLISRRRFYIPRPRTTIVHSPMFYARSHGGFGGPRARPTFHGVLHRSGHGG